MIIIEKLIHGIKAIIITMVILGEKMIIIIMLVPGQIMIVIIIMEVPGEKVKIKIIKIILGEILM